MFLGCSDSRKTINAFTQTGPGELFVLRNVANQVSQQDGNGMAGIEYAVKALKVSHIIVCGHHLCGGVRAAMSEQKGNGYVEKWISGIRSVYSANKNELDALENPRERENRLSELNVIQQLRNLCETSILKEAFKEDRYPRFTWVDFFNWSQD